MQIVSLPPDEIIVPPNRQRGKPNPRYQSILDSVTQHGVLNPILVQKGPQGYVLVAGHTRLMVCRALNIPIPCHIADETFGADSIEFVENYCRSDLSWQDQCRAISEIHKRFIEKDPFWTQKQTAAYLCADESDVSRVLTVVESLANDPGVAGQKSLGAAYKAVNQQRRMEIETAVTNVVLNTNFDDIFDGETPTETNEPLPDPTGPLICDDFILWQERYDGPKFNVVHCDFPYGRSDYVGHGDRWTRYTDTPDIYFQLLDAVLNSPHIEKDAVIFCWLDMKHYCATNAAMKHNGWEPTTWPFILHKTNRSGFMPGTYGGRRTYEVMHYATRGTPAIGTKKSLLGAYEVQDNVLLNHAEKPKDFLIEKMGMFVGKHSRFLDPTCGSGTAVQAAIELGAAYAVGVDKNANLIAWANARILTSV